MRKAIFVIADFLLCVFCLMGCGKEQEQTSQELLLNYGIVYAEESLLYLPNQITCDENGAWIAPATAEQLLLI